MRERLTISPITRTDEHSLRSQVGIGSESDCLFGQLERICWTQLDTGFILDSFCDGMVDALHMVTSICCDVCYVQI